jgi:hypothetical protein
MQLCFFMPIARLLGQSRRSLTLLIISNCSCVAYKRFCRHLQQQLRIKCDRTTPTIIITGECSAKRSIKSNLVSKISFDLIKISFCLLILVFSASQISFDLIKISFCLLILVFSASQMSFDLLILVFSASQMSFDLLKISFDLLI